MSSTQFAFGGTPFEPLVPIVDPESGMQLSQEVAKAEPSRINPEHYAHDKELMLAEMLLRAKRSPTDWKPATFVFDGVSTVQIAAIRPGRQTIILFNGTNSIIVARKESGIKSNENFTLAQGASVNFDTEGPLWAFSATSGTTLSVVELYYDLEQMALAKGRKTGNERQWDKHPQPDTIYSNQ